MTQSINRNLTLERCDPCAAPNEQSPSPLRAPLADYEFFADTGSALNGGARRPGERVELKDDQRVEAQRLWDGGVSYHRIGIALGVSERAVSRTLRAARRRAREAASPVTGESSDADASGSAFR